MVEILKYTQVDKNKVRGYVDVKLPILKPANFIIRRIAHMVSGNKEWLNLPSFMEETRNGKQFPKYFEFELGTLNAAFMAALKEKLAQYFAEHPEISNLPHSAPSSDQTDDFIPF